VERAVMVLLEGEYLRVGKGEKGPISKSCRGFGSSSAASSLA
jgi:hypothetical protein